MQVSAEGGGTTKADVTQDLVLLAGENRSPAFEELLLVSVEDIGYFEPMWSHRLLPSPSEVVMSRIARSSSGLAVACSRCSETCR